MPRKSASFLRPFTERTAPYGRDHRELVESRVLACTCNGTVALDETLLSSRDPASAARCIGQSSELCRRDVKRFVDALDAQDDLVVTCVQEAPLFAEIANARKTLAPIRFVDLRESAGWGGEGHRAGPKIAALVAMAARDLSVPVAAVPYRSTGRTLVIGPPGAALRWAERLSGKVDVSVLLSGSDGTALPAARAFPVFSGDAVAVSGWLGAFEVRWSQQNPIDLDACVRCGACVAACPEGAIDAGLQVDLDRCGSHRGCVRACGSIGAIDFSRTDRERREHYDLVLDLRAAPAFQMHQPPQGYFFPGPEPDARTDAAMALIAMTGEFEKPKFFTYRAALCAHKRNETTGCTRCIDVCSTAAIASDGQGVRVEPHLCMGCGACATVCPSGAMSFNVPAPSELGRRLRIGLKAYRDKAGSGGAVLFHDTEAGRERIEQAARDAGEPGRAGPARSRPTAPGLPARVIPVQVHHPAAVGLDVALAAIAFGAEEVLVLLAGVEAPQYAAALREQFDVGNAVLDALGYGAQRLAVIQAEDGPALSRALYQRKAPPRAIATVATFALPDDKRRAIEFAVDHLVAQAHAAGRQTPERIPLQAGAPFGAITVDRDACTLCLACAGACPESALLDGGEQPQLRLLERNCVQCGLCEKTCPENAIRLVPRLSLAADARQAVVINQGEPFACVSCGKPFGTRQMVERMIGRLQGHSMFAGGGRRLQMCADCRVVDMFSATNEVSIFDAKGRS